MFGDCDGIRMVVGRHSQSPVGSVTRCSLGRARMTRSISMSSNNSGLLKLYLKTNVHRECERIHICALRHIEIDISVTGSSLTDESEV